MSTWDTHAHDLGDWVRHGLEAPDGLSRQVDRHDFRHDKSVEWYEHRYNQLWYNLSPDERAELYEYEPNYNHHSLDTSLGRPQYRDERAEAHQYSEDWFDIRAKWYDQAHHDKQNQNHNGNNGFDVMNEQIDYADWSQFNVAHGENGCQADITNWSQQSHEERAFDRDPQGEKQGAQSLLTETMEQFKRTMNQAICAMNQKLDMIETALAARNTQIIETKQDLITEEVPEIVTMAEHNEKMTERQEENVAVKQEEIVGAKMPSECEDQGTEIGNDYGLINLNTQRQGKSALVNFHSSKVMKFEELPCCLAQIYVSGKMVDFPVAQLLKEHSHGKYSAPAKIVVCFPNNVDILQENIGLVLFHYHMAAYCFIILLCCTKTSLVNIFTTSLAGGITSPTSYWLGMLVSEQNRCIDAENEISIGTRLFSLMSLFEAMAGFLFVVLYDDSMMPLDNHSSLIPYCESQPKSLTIYQSLLFFCDIYQRGGDMIVSLGEIYRRWAAQEMDMSSHLVLYKLQAVNTTTVLLLVFKCVSLQQDHQSVSTEAYVEPTVLVFRFFIDQNILFDSNLFLQKSTTRLDTWLMQQLCFLCGLRKHSRQGNVTTWRVWDPGEHHTPIPMCMTQCLLDGVEFCWDGES